MQYQFLLAKFIKDEKVQILAKLHIDLTAHT